MFWRQVPLPPRGHLHPRPNPLRPVPTGQQPAKVHPQAAGRLQPGRLCTPGSGARAGPTRPSLRGPGEPSGPGEGGGPGAGGRGPAGEEGE